MLVVNKLLNVALYSHDAAVWRLSWVFRIKSEFCDFSNAYTENNT